MAEDQDKKKKVKNKQNKTMKSSSLWDPVTEDFQLFERNPLISGPQSLKIRTSRAKHKTRGTQKASYSFYFLISHNWVQCLSKLEVPTTHTKITRTHIFWKGHSCQQDRVQKGQRKWNISNWESKLESKTNKNRKGNKNSRSDRQNISMGFLVT